jgi:hypothetical protein
MSAIKIIENNSSRLSNNQYLNSFDHLNNNLSINSSVIKSN